MRSSLVSVSLLALFTVPGLAATPKPTAPTPARHLPAPEDVAPQTRREVKARMAQHATLMQSLVRAVVLLDRPTVAVIADRVAGDQTFAASATSSLSLSPEVFGAQDAFAAAARELAFAAATTRTNDAVLADRFAALTRTCVTCHSGYVRGQRPRHPIGDEPIERDPQRPDGQLHNESSQSPRPAAR